MKRFLAFIIILSAALSMINADFVQCPNPPIADYTTTIGVSVSPDPVVPNTSETFTVSGSLEKEITSNYKLIVTFTDDVGRPLIPPSVTEICNVYYCCPIASEVFITLVKSVVSPDQSLLSQPYVVVVTISETTDQPDIIGCAMDLVGVSSNSYPFDAALNHITSYLSASLYSTTDTTDTTSTAGSCP